MKVPVNPTPQGYSQSPDTPQQYEQAVDYTAGQRQLAEVVSKYAQYAEDQQKKREMFDVNKALVDETNSIQQDFQQKIQVQPLGAPNFTQQVAGEYTTRHDALVKQFKDQGYSSDAIDELQTRLGALRSSMVARAIDFQEKSNFTKGVNDLKDLSDSLSLYSNNNPMAVGTALDELHNGLRNSGLNPVEQAQIQDQLEAPIRRGAQEGFATQHPEMVMGLFGLPEEKTPVTSPTNLPAGQTFSMPDYLNKILHAEGTAKNPASTARGFGQFLDSTWVGVYKEVYGNTGESNAQILAKKGQKDIATKLTEQLTNGNIQQLTSHDKPVNDATVYLAHFLGIHDALAVLSAHADESIANLITNSHSSDPKKNPLLANKNVFKNIHNAGDMLAWAQDKMGVTYTTQEASSAGLPPIPKGWKGNVEDAIQELGMTADQAQTYLQTGQDTRVAGQAPSGGIGPVTASATVPAQVPGLYVDPATGKTGIPALDEATGPERMQMLTIARTIMNEREVAARSAQNAAHEEWYNGFLNSLQDGKSGQAELNQAYAAGQFKSYEERMRAQGILDNKNKGQEDLARFGIILKSGIKANPFDPDSQKAVDAGFSQAVTYAQKNGMQDADPLAIGLRAWQRTGILPTQVGTMLRGGLVGTNPEQVKAAASVASNMLKENPNAFAGVNGGDEIGKAAANYAHYVDDLGMTDDEAANKIAQQNSPEYQAKIKADDSQRQQFITSLTGDKTHASTINIQKIVGGSPSLLGRIEGQTSVSLTPEQNAEARQTYLELALDHFDKFHDPSAAQSYAERQVQRLYGIEGGRFVKYPASKAYPQINGDNSYIYNQAKEFVDKAAGQSVPTKDIWLVPTASGSTAQAFRNGAPPPYEVHYITHQDGQAVYHVIPGKVFMVDMNKARADAAKSAAAYERSLRKTVVLPGIGPVGG